MTSAFVRNDKQGEQSQQGVPVNRRLQRFQSSKTNDLWLGGRINCTADLVERLNQTKDADDRQYLLSVCEKYSTCFYRSDYIYLDDCLEYATLAGINPICKRSTDFLKQFFSKLCNDISLSEYQRKYLIPALRLILQSIDESILKESTADLYRLVNSLLNGVKAGLVISRETYNEHAPVLQTIYEVLEALFRMGAVGLDGTQKDGAYAKFTTTINELKKLQTYYPSDFELSLIDHSLRNLKDAANTYFPLSKRISSGLNIVGHVYRALRPIPHLDVNVEAFCDAFNCLSASQAIKLSNQCNWSGCFQVFKVSVDANIRFEGKLELFQVSYAKIIELAGILHDNEKRAMRFGIIQELKKLATNGCSLEVRKDAGNKLLSLADPSLKDSWLCDTVILEALLDSLLDVYARGDCMAATENTLRRLISLVEQNTSQRRQQLAKRRTVEEQSIVDGISLWLDDDCLDEKLKSRRWEEPQPSRLFDWVRNELGVYQIKEDVRENYEELREKYKLDKNKKAKRLFNDTSRKNVMDLEHHLLLCEELQFSDAQRSRQLITESGELVEDQILRHHDRQSSKRVSIELRDLFQPRKGSRDLQPTTISRVLLVGNPGTGKTTISQKIAYSWAMKEWGEEFDALYLVPVREMCRDKLDNGSVRRERTIETAIANLCYQHRNNDDLFKALRKQISYDIRSEKTLLILDGLDESDEVAKEIITHVLYKAQARMLLISRPFDVHEEQEKSDRSVECVGMSQEQLVRFIQREFKEESKTLLEFLAQNRHLEEFARVPVIAAILCSVWKERSDQFTAQTECTSMMLLHSEMEIHLWKRFAETQRSMQCNHEKISQMLEQIAYNATFRRQIFIKQSLVERIATTTLMDSAFVNSGFMLLQRASANDFQFPHLTLQEYFAAKYLARSMLNRTDGSRMVRERAADFVSKNKYAPEHRLVLSFTVQKLCQSDGVECFEELLELVNREPVEIVGVQHFFRKLQILDDFIAVSEAFVRQKIYTISAATCLANSAAAMLFHGRSVPMLMRLTVVRLRQLPNLLRHFPTMLDDWMAALQDDGPKIRQEIDLVESLARYARREAQLEEIRTKQWPEVATEAEDHSTVELDHLPLKDLFERYFAGEKDCIKEISQRLLRVPVTVSVCHTERNKQQIQSHGSRSDTVNMLRSTAEVEKLMKAVSAYLNKHFPKELLRNVPELTRHDGVSLSEEVESFETDVVEQKQLADEELPPLPAGPSPIDQLVTNLRPGYRYHNGKYRIMEAPADTKPYIKYAEDTLSGDLVFLWFSNGEKEFDNAILFHEHLKCCKHVCKIRDILDPDSGFPRCLVIQRGKQSMENWLEEQNATSTMQERKAILREILDALAEIHRNDVVCCTLTPEQIIQFPSSDWRVLLLGRAQLCNSSVSWPITADLKRFYTPPELLVKTDDVTAVQIDGSIDVWAFGAISYEVLSERRLHNVIPADSTLEDQLKLRRRLPGMKRDENKPAWEFIKSMLRQKPHERATAASAAASMFLGAWEDTLHVEFNPKKEATNLRGANVDLDPNRQRYGSRRPVPNVKAGVFTAEDMNTGDWVILKIRDQTLNQNSQDFHRKLNRADHVCRLIDVVNEDDMAIIVFEKGEETLEEWMNDHSTSMNERRRVLVEITTALCSIHGEGVVYGDLQPSNIMRFGDGRWKVLELNAASEISKPSQIPPTNRYSAPEIIIAERQQLTEIKMQPSADMWSLGMIAFELFTGERFFAKDLSLESVREILRQKKISLQQIDTILDEDDRRFVKKLLRVEPTKRRDATKALASRSLGNSEDTTTTTLAYTSNIQ